MNTVAKLGKSVHHKKTKKGYKVIKFCTEDGGRIKDLVIIGYSLRSLNKLGHRSMLLSKNSSKNRKSGGLKPKIASFHTGAVPNTKL